MPLRLGKETQNRREQERRHQQYAHACSVGLGCTGRGADAVKDVDWDHKEEEDEERDDRVDKVADSLAREVINVFVVGLFAEVLN
jgi:hypothetical protein